MNTRWTPSGVPAHKGAALIIVLAFMALLTGLALAYFSHTATDRQLAQASFHDASADLLARTALDIIVSSLKREIAVAGVNVTQANIQPQRSGDDASIPNLIRRSVRNDAISQPLPNTGCRQLHTARLGVGNPSGTEPCTGAQRCSWTLCFRGLRRGRLARYESGRISRLGGQ